MNMSLTKRCQKNKRLLWNFERATLIALLFVMSAYSGFSNKVAEKNRTALLFADVDLNGKVVDSKTGEPLAGVTVRVVENSKGTITNADGEFSLSVPDNAKLEISFVGYNAQVVNVGGRSNILVHLESSSTGLDELVVVGYGTQKKKNLSTSLVSLSGEDLNNSKDNVGIAQALKGKAAGVQVQQNSGQPGSALQVRIRGVGSISGGNSPLWVIDNVPTTDPNIIRNLDLSDIKSINVLKGAAAAAIYGSRGSNGVVIVERKSGEAGKTSISVSYDQGWSMIGKKIDVLNGPEEARFIKAARDNAWLSDGGSLSDPMSARPYTRQYPEEWNDPGYEVPTYDYQDFVFRTAALKNLTASASGGTENARYFLSGTYSDEEGIVKRSDFKHYSFFSNIDVKLTKFASLKVSLNPSFTNTSMPGVSGPEKGYHRTIMSTPYAFSPLSGVPGSGIPPITSGYFATPLFNNGVPNFLWLKDKEKGTMLQSSADLRINILPELQYDLFTGFLYNQDHRDIFSPSIITDITNQQPHGSYSETRQQNLVVNHTLTYTKTFNERHNFSGMIGFSNELHKSFSSSITGLNFPTDFVETMNQALDIDGATLKSEWSLISILGRLSYDFDGRYLLGVNFRRDGSSRFGKNNKWGTFPSISAGWIISEEDFFRSSLINFLKIRGGYGFTGNDQIGDYTHIPLMSITYAAFGNSETLNTGLYPSNPGNENLSWEKSRSMDLGLTINLIGDRITFDMDLYRKITNDLLINVGLPAHSGFLNQIMNLGQVLNKGIEFEASSHNLVGNFKWTTNFNLAFNRNRVQKLGINNSPILGPRRHGFYSITEVGHPIGSYYLLNQIGVWNSEEEINNNPHWAGAKPGTPRMEDWNNDGKVDLDDRHIIIGAPPIPTYSWGIRNEFSYKNFDLSVFINGAGGNKILDDEGVTSAEGDSHTEHNGLWRDFWESPDKPGNGLAGQPNDRLSGSEGQVSTRSLADGSYFQLNNLSVGYTFPKKVIKNIKLDNLKISFTGNNLWIHDKAPFLFNVEGQSVDSGDPLSGGGYANSTYPLSRQFIFSLKVSF